MANPTNTTVPIGRGLAIITGYIGGVPSNISVWANGVLPQSTDATYNFDVEKIKDIYGSTAVMLARDSNITRTFELKPTSGTLAQAKAATVFFAAFAKMTFASSDAADLDGDWIVMEGQQIQIKNDQSASVRVNCMKFVDSTQNTNLNTAVTLS